MTALRQKIIRNVSSTARGPRMAGTAQVYKVINLYVPLNVEIIKLFHQKRPAMMETNQILINVTHFVLAMLLDGLAQEVALPLPQLVSQLAETVFEQDWKYAMTAFK